MSGPMNKHQNNAQHDEPYKDQPTSHETGGTRNPMAHGGGVHGHGSHGHHHGVPGHGTHGHKHQHKHGRKG